MPSEPDDLSRQEVEIGGGAPPLGEPPKGDRGSAPARASASPMDEFDEDDFDDDFDDDYEDQLADDYDFDHEMIESEEDFDDLDDDGDVDIGEEE